MQADDPFRMLPSDIEDWYVRNGNGEMVQLVEFTSGSWTTGSPKLTRFNGSSTREIQGSPAEGVSSGAAFAEVERIAKELPAGLGVSWTGISYEEEQAGANTGLLYLISALAVFVILAALYESWAIPISIMLVVPLGIFGAVLATWLTGQANDVYFQVGLLITIGLAAKNAILVVEFAKINFEKGMRAYDAAYTAAQQRFRPIIMTSLTSSSAIAPPGLLATVAGVRRAERDQSIGVSARHHHHPVSWSSSAPTSSSASTAVSRRKAPRAREPPRGPKPVKLPAAHQRKRTAPGRGLRTDGQSQSSACPSMPSGWSRSRTSHHQERRRTSHGPSGITRKAIRCSSGPFRDH